MSIPELDMKVITLKEIQTEIERLEAEAEAIKDLIKQTMIDRGEETLSGNGWKASWKIVESNRLDTKALKTVLPDIAAKFTVTARTSRFIIN